MDDTNDRAYSRAPELEDLVNLCRSLNAYGVKYVLIGGFAVILQGSVRGTKDIDLLVETSTSNIANVKKAMSTLPDNAIALIADDDVEKYLVVRVADEIIVDLMAKACGIDYASASREIDWMEVEGARIPVASKSLLIRMKDTVRPSDKSDIGFLQTLMDEERPAIASQSGSVFFSILWAGCFWLVQYVLLYIPTVGRSNALRDVQMRAPLLWAMTVVSLIVAFVHRRLDQSQQCSSGKKTGILVATAGGLVLLEFLWVVANSIRFP